MKKTKDYPESAFIHCTNCGERDLRYVPRVKTKQTTRIDSIILTIISIIFIILGIITYFNAHEILYDILSGKTSEIITYTAVQQRSLFYFILGICILLLTLVIQLVKNKKTDTVIMAVCPKCGKVSQNNFID